MLKVNLNFELARPKLNREFLLKSSIGAIVGFSTKALITVLSKAPLTALAALGWTAAGLVAGIALCFFKRKQSVNQEPANRVENQNGNLSSNQANSEGKNAIVENKSLDVCLTEFQNHWHWIKNLDIEEAAKLNKIKLLNEDSFEKVWNPQVFAIAVFAFAKENKELKVDSYLDVFTSAKDNIENFSQFLIDIKIKKKNLSEFEEKAAHFISNYIPIRINKGDFSFIRGKASKLEFEEDLKKFIEFVLVYG